MKKHHLQLIMTVATLPLALQELPANAQTKQERRQTAINALAKVNGVHEAARISGGTFFISDPFLPGWFLFAALEALSAHSDIAVIGIPMSAEPRLADNGRSIVTGYKFRIQEVIQGDIQPEDTITIDVPGGKLTFDDGMTAEIEVPNFRKMVEGRRYLVYLWAPASGPRAYTPTGGADGVFELKADRKVLPHGLAHGQEDTWAANRDEDEQQFRDEVKFALRAQKAR